MYQNTEQTLSSFKIMKCSKSNIIINVEIIDCFMTVLILFSQNEPFEREKNSFFNFKLIINIDFLEIKLLFIATNNNLYQNKDDINDFCR